MKNTGLSPLSWFGGKQNLVGLLLSLLPEHKTYVEVFGGAASLLFSKPPTALEVYNDIDSDLVNFFRVLRDPVQSWELQMQLELTPFAREEYQQCFEVYRSKAYPTSIEQARVFFTLANQAFAAQPKKSWGYTTHPDKHEPRAFANKVDNLESFTKRLRYVEIEHNDFAKILEAYDSPDTLFYLDPPYVHSTRRAGKYQHEMTDSDHIRLLTIITHLQGKVVLSGYDSELYQSYLNSWHREIFETTSHAVGRTRQSGLKGKHVTEKQKRTEIIWISPTAMNQPRLFDLSEVTA